MTTDPIRNTLAGMRLPRVTLTYPVDSADPAAHKQLPFVLGVLADLSGHRETPLPSLLTRDFFDLDIDNFDTALARIAPQLAFSVDIQGQPFVPDAHFDVRLRFHALEDFSPGSIASQVPALAAMLERRRTLSRLQEALEQSEHLHVLLSQAMSVQDTNAVAALSDELIFRALVTGVPIAEEQLRTLVPAFVSELQTTAGPRVSTNPEVFVQDRMRALDRQLSTYVNALLHSAPFQPLEAAWRGLYYLASQTESGPNLKIRVLDISQKELCRDLLRASAFDTSILFKRVHDDVYGSRDGVPFAALILDFAFGPQPQDVQTLSLLSNVGAAINAPFIAAASPEMLGQDTFGESTPATHQLSRLFEQALYRPWRLFRESQDSRFVALALPRILLRLPYGSTGQLVEAFDHEEDVFPNKHHHYLWGNAAYAFAAVLANAFSRSGWCAAISGASGGVVDGLPAHFLDPSEEGTTGPLEVVFDEKREFELAKLGFLPLSLIKAANQAIFFTALSCHQPGDPGDVGVAARLSYLLCAARFAHYLCCIVRDAPGPARTPVEWEACLNAWISQYVLDHETAGIGSQADRPLSQARIAITQLPGTPGTHAAVFYLHPRFQLEDLPVGYRVLAHLPAILRVTEPGSRETL